MRAKPISRTVIRNYAKIVQRKASRPLVCHPCAPSDSGVPRRNFLKRTPLSTSGSSTPVPEWMEKRLSLSLVASCRGRVEREKREYPLFGNRCSERARRTLMKFPTRVAWKRVRFQCPPSYEINCNTALLDFHPSNKGGYTISLYT